PTATAKNQYVRVTRIPSPAPVSERTVSQLIDLAQSDRQSQIATGAPALEMCFAVWEYEVLLEIAGPSAWDVCEDLYASGFQLYGGIIEAPWSLCKIYVGENLFRVSRPLDNASWDDLGEADLGVCDWLWSESELP
ncbi:hypothetical protein LCGC14_2359920, partial [marine sediment metagenome]